MSIRAMVDVAIDEDRSSRCLWLPTEYWEAFCEELGRQPNGIGVIVYRNTTIREGEPYSDITTRRPD
ncbi:MAG TPA: hypothetical protein VFE13_02810 [Caulobacteraceae bacterium]|jgi:hypothetical protein|nr:hypothetical protein [Caulobacteraceae bacterium]